jgi:LPXTG-motif cell wall-anchored protein
VNKALIYLAATPLVLAPVGVGAGAASAAELTSEGSNVTSEGSNLNVSDVVGVSQTDATAGDAGGSASAGTVTVREEPLIDGVTGGTQDGTGRTSGAVAETDKTPVGSATVGGYEAQVSESDSRTTSSSSASLLEATVGDEDTVTVSVLESSSTATSQGGQSSTNGVVLDVGGGDLEVVLLHSESGTARGDSPFVASLNGQQIVSSGQADGCVVEAAPLAEVLCVTAEEGQTTIESESSIVDVQVVEDRLFLTLGRTASGVAEEPAAETDQNNASAAALLIPGVLGVSQTEATAGESASAGVVTVAGDPLLEGLGGTQEGEGSTSGSLIDTGETPLGAVAVAPYEAAVEGDRSSSRASVLEASLINGETVSVDVLTSESAASRDGAQSSSQGVVVELGGGQLEVVVLDSSADGEGNGSAAVARVNGEPVLASEQADGCVLDADPLAQVACVTAEQGRTTIETEAAVADVQLVEDQLVVTVGGATAEAGDDRAVAAASQDTPQESGSASEGSGSQGSASSDGSFGEGSGTASAARTSTALPVTGAEMTLLALAGMGALASGAGVLVAAGRRRTGEAVA